MRESLLDLPALERYEICKDRIQTISILLTNAIHLNEMCERIIFTDSLSRQIPHSYAGHAYSLLQRTLVKQLTLNLCSLWDQFGKKQSEDRNSFPAIVILLDQEVIALAKERSYNHWYSGVEPDLGFGYEHLTTEQIISEKERLSQELAENQSQYIEPCLHKVMHRMPMFLESTLIKTTRDFRNYRLAHHLEVKKSKKKVDIDPTLNWGAPRKLLLLSLWCCHNLSLGLLGHDQNFKSSFEVAKIYSDDLWDNCTFNIPLN